MGKWSLISACRVPADTLFRSVIVINRSIVDAELQVTRVWELITFAHPYDSSNAARSKLIFEAEQILTLRFPLINTMYLLAVTKSKHLSWKARKRPISACGGDTPQKKYVFHFVVLVFCNWGFTL